MGWIPKNHIKTRREFKTFYRKNTGVLLEIISGNIKKEKLNPKELVKGNCRYHRGVLQLQYGVTGS